MNGHITVGNGYHVYRREFPDGKRVELRGTRGYRSSVTVEQPGQATIYHSFEWNESRKAQEWFDALVALATPVAEESAGEAEDAA